MVDRGVVPACGEVRVDGDGFGLGTDGDAKETAQGGRDDHGTRPELVAGTPTKGNKEIAAEEFGVGAEILRPGQVGVLLQELIAGERLVGAVFRERSPAGEERPDGALVVAETVVDFFGV